MLSICVLRLVQMQLLADSSLQDEIAQLKLQRMQSTQLKTVRGSILDRHGNVLATDVPRFQITIGYRLSCYADTRVRRARELLAHDQSGNPALVDLHNEISAKLEDLTRIINDCAEFGAERRDIVERIAQANDTIWNLRTYLAWVRSTPDPNLVARYGGQAGRVPQAEALADFQRLFPDSQDRYKRILKVNDIPELDSRFPLAELPTEEDVFAAQMEFLDVNDVEIAPSGYRSYPYGSVAAQTIGWVGPATQARDMRLFADDPLARYQPGEVCGREDGVEYACESILRGRRGEEVSDIDEKLVRETQPRFGQDIQLTIDINLQKQIEEWTTDPEVNVNFDANTAIAVLDIRSGDILAMVSLPSYDLNRARYDYGRLKDDPNDPLINRVLNALYPPGSVVKPLILAAGLETGAITPEEVIHCPAAPAPDGWPDCWIWRQHHAGHDWSWENNARNALRGSCNIYFSHLADRIEPRTLQEWLFKFGYGHQILDDGALKTDDGAAIRHLREFAGQIASTAVPASATIESFDQIPSLRPAERRLFGIGHGNLRATPLQVANSFAALARGGQYIPPRLFIGDDKRQATDLHISRAHLQVIHDGLDAVINETGGTAYEAFRGSELPGYGVKVYGKTGSTERPEHAWFAGFAEDPQGAKIAVAVVVEGGEHGSSDAAPLGRDVIELCAKAGYVGTEVPLQ
jgi:penicillin-binding protein 2